MELSFEKFEEIVKEGIRAIPQKFLEKLNNVDICLEQEPNPSQLKNLKKKRGTFLFGLYEGIPQTKRSHYSEVLPDKITIFKKPIEKFANSEKEIREIVKNTIWHEIAHHFGMDEERVQKIERQRKIRL